MTSFAPKSGPVSGNTTIQLKGTNFSSTTVLTCLFGGEFGYAATEATYVSSSLIVCTSPKVNQSMSVRLHVCGATTVTTQTFFYYEEPDSLVSSLTAIPKLQNVGADPAKYTLTGNNLFLSDEIRVRYKEASGVKEFEQIVSGNATRVEELYANNPVVDTSLIGLNYPLKSDSNVYFQAQYSFTELSKRGFCSSGATSCIFTSASKVILYVDTAPDPQPSSFSIKYQVITTDDVVATLDSQSKKMVYSNVEAFIPVFTTTTPTLTAGWNEFTLSEDIQFDRIASSDYKLLIQIEAVTPPASSGGEGGSLGFRQSFAGNAIKTYTDATANAFSTTYPWQNIDEEYIVPRLVLCSGKNCGAEVGIIVEAPDISSVVETGDTLKVEVAMNGQQYSPNTASLGVYGLFSDLTLTPRVAPRWGNTRVKQALEWACRGLGEGRQTTQHRMNII